MSQHVGDLFVVDDELANTGGKLASHRNYLSEVLEDYIQIADWLCSKQEGEYINSLRDYVGTLRDIPNKIVSAGMYLQTDCEGFVSQIDEADVFLYGK